VFATGVQHALVAARGEGYGVARMYIAYAEMHGDQVGIFLEPAEAAAWLGVPLQVLLEPGEPSAV
jgi:hypothetical protein